MKTRLLAMLLALGLALPVSAQVSVPNTLVAGTTITAAGLNTNFSTIANHALDRLSGGTISGNIAVDNGITIDGIDISAALCSSCAATFASLTVNSVTIVNTSGKIPAISATYFTSLDGSALTNIGDASLNTLSWTKISKSGSSLADLVTRSAADLSSGTVATARLGSGSATTSTFLRGDNSWAAPALGNLAVTSQSGTYAVLTTDNVVEANGTFTVTLPTAVGVTGKTYFIKNIGTGTITIATTSAQTIDGVTTQTLPVQYMSYTIASDGSNWIIL